MVYFNGAYIDVSTLQIDAQNRAFKYGDAVFESCLYHAGRVPLLSYNLSRMLNGMRILQLEIPAYWDASYFSQVIHTMALHHGLQTARAKITVWRAGGGLYRPQTHAASLLVELFPLDASPFSTAATPYRLGVFTEYPRLIHPLSACKTANALPYVLAAMYAQREALDDVLLLNTEETIADAISSNIWMLSGHTLTTTPVLNGGVCGTMQDWLCDHAEDLGYRFSRKPLFPDDLQDAEALFLTNAIQGIRPVTWFRGKQFDNKLPIRLLEEVKVHLLT